ncbi:ABC-2 type transport system permease protein [Clostridium aceticum]|uniref:ABC-2 type transport system permease protein n=1 Tax=Clostridium aceticum TaxID=84022 RepID=A0A0D8IAT5_9CLOT|nr:hypothetical protein [Clostridium aceticum]AKL96430.1 ABC-2 type transport system permease protein [Clostridium aceticum]KJF27395.1 hypothetical protein TZ02_08650 [Clostridium aceticum]
MNKFIALTKIQVKDFLSKYVQHLNVKNKWFKIIILILPALLIFPALQLVNRMYDIFYSIGFSELTITYMYIGNVMMMFFAGIPLIISTFFYAKDLRFLATLPVRSDIIVFSKLTTVYLYLLAIGCFFFGTSVIVYSTKGGLQLVSLVTGLIALLLSPLLPMILSALIVIPLMSLIGGGNKRNMMVMVGNLLLLAAIIYLQMALTRIEMDPEALSSLLLQEDGLLRLLGRSFPPSIWLTKMVQGSLANGGFFILVNLVFIFILKLVSSLLYTKGLMAFNQEGGGLVEKGKIYYKVRSKRVQMIKRHIGVIFSNPVFFLNTVLTMFIPVLMFVIMSFTGEVTSELFNSPMLAPYLIYIYTAVITAPAIVGSLSATVISREGKAFWETKVLPISTGDNIKYRIYAMLILSLVGSITLAIIGAIYLPVTYTMLLIAAAFCISATLFFSTIDIIINIQRPMLNWTSPTAAVKNNFNVIFSLLIKIVVGGVLYLLYLIIPDLGASVMILGSSVLFLILYVVASYFLFGRYKERFDSIEL